MNSRDQLNQYLHGLETRLRLLVVSRGAAVALGVALGATLALVLITNYFAFSSASLVIARIVLFVSLAVALGLGLVIPLMKLNQRRAAGKAETAYPGFEERLLTYVERREGSDPMIELLAADTLERSPQAPASRVVPQKSIFAFGLSAGAAGALLLWMILAGPGFLGFGAKTLWAGPPKGAGASYYDIVVTPGNKLVRRRADLPIAATLVGFQSPTVKLMARYKSSAKWEEAPMLPGVNGSYEFLFTSVPEPVEYYVDAAGVKSKTYKIDVIDLPGVKNIKVTYHFPSWLGIQPIVENPGGDLRAVVDTVAQLDIETDRPLKNGFIELSDGTKVSLEQGQGNMLLAKIPIQKDGSYHFAASESSENVRLTQDYFIEAQQDSAPTVKINHPGSDAKVSPIEEVTVKVDASDDFGLQAVELHYSVNGQPEKVISLLDAKGGKTSDGKTTLYLEDFKLLPGDFVSMYATAKDARSKTTSDISFVEAQPYEKNYSQSQQSGGGGGGGGGGGQQEQDQIAQRQRQIIAATHNAVNGGPKNPTATAENAQFLSETEAKLKEQAESLANRTNARELTDTNDQFKSFTNEMKAAAAEMAPASDKLKAQKWADAIAPEERALQHLQRAMATFRDIQVARGQQGGGGGGGGGGGAARDLANLFDLELDTEKNQYEQAQQGGQSGEQQQQKIDEAMQKLEQLAKRQKELADQNRNNKQANNETQRYNQEMLRREAEELKKQLEQLQQQQAQSQSSQGQSQSAQGQSQGQSQSKGGKQGSQGSQSGQQRASAQQMQQMLDQLNKAMEDQRAAQQARQNGDQTQADANARRAAERLQDAGDIGKRLQRQGTAEQLGGLQERADQIAAQQKDYESRLKQAAGQGDGKNRQPGMTRQQAEDLAKEEEKMLADVKKLEADATKQARDLRNTQPDASSKLREGLAAIQQQDAERRMEYSSEYIRAGQGSTVVQWQAPVTQALEGFRDNVRQAQQALRDGSQQGAAKNDQERQLATIEQMRRQIEQLKQPGNQPGQQKGNQPGQGKDGQGKDGKGGGNQPGGNQPGGNQPGANNSNPNGGGAQFGPNGGPYGAQFGRYNPQGVFEPGTYNGATVDPRQMVRDYSRQIAELRQYYRDNPDMLRQIGEVQKELERVGDTAGPELEQRLSRTVLPQLETLEVQIRREAADKTGGTVRSGGTDRMPAGYSESVYEYFRNLNKSTK